MYLLDRCIDVLVPVGTAGAGFLRPDALPDGNQIINIWNEVRSWVALALNSLAQGPVTRG